MRLKTFLIATLIIGAMTFPFRHNVMPVIARSASPATSTATAAAAQDINPLASYDARITDFNPYNLLFGWNVLPGATHSAFPATLTATAAAAPSIEPPYQYDVRIRDTSFVNNLLSQGGVESPVFMYSRTNYCDEAWRFVSTDIFNPQGPFQIKHSNNGTCLVVRGDANGARGVQGPCGTQWADQLWYAEDIGGGTYRFRNANSGKYLCHAGTAQVRQYSISGYSGNPGSYQWKLNRWDGRIDSSGKCVAPGAP